MRIFLMADYWMGLQVAKFLNDSHEDIVGLAIHPPESEKEINRGFTKKIINTLSLPQERIFQWEEIKSGRCLGAIKSLNPDIALVVFWNFIFKKEFIDLFPKGCINFHMAYLPFNRGANPNVWPIIEGTPAGVTLHYIDERVDAGDIIAQAEVHVEAADTGFSLYEKMQNEFYDLFARTWPFIRSGKISRTPQSLEKGTYHSRNDFASLDCIDLNRTYKAGELIDLLRARTFRPFPSAYFIDEQGRKVFVRVDLEYEK